MCFSKWVVGLRDASAETFDAAGFRVGRFFDVSSVVPMANLQCRWAVVRCSAVCLHCRAPLAVAAPSSLSAGRNEMKVGCANQLGSNRTVVCSRLYMRTDDRIAELPGTESSRMRRLVH